MRLKAFFFNLLLIFTSLPVLSQTWNEVRNSNAYLYGEGWGVTVAEADQQALRDLISKISVQVTGTTTHKEEETSSDTGITGSSSFSSLVNTYSSATLTNTQKEIIENEPDAHVARWIKKSDVAKIFEARKNKISDYISSALKAESQGKIDIALKDLYWAFALIKTLQDPNDYKYVDENGESLLGVSGIPRQMNEIFDNLEVKIANRNGDDVELFITYRGIPVNSVDYTFFDGRDWSNIYSAKDGTGVLELAPGNQNAHYQIKFEYEYKGEAHIDNELPDVINAIGTIPMRNAYKTVKTTDTSSVSTSKKVSPSKNSNQNINKEQSLPSTDSFASISPEIFNMPKPIERDEEYKKILNELANAIVAKRYNDADNLFTPDARDIYQRLIKYGNAKIVGKPVFTFFQYGDNVIARGLQMAFSFKSGMRKSFVEEVIFSFNPEGKINNISFGLGKTAENDILGKGVWSENARFAIMNFLENYQTAYALKRLDYISSIFDDDAVIITGTVTHVPAKKISKGDLKGIQFEHDIIKYNRHTKDSYLKYLKRSFDSKEYINLRFASNDVRKLGKGGEVYAIQISQEYYSSNYGDKGYLFLMVDINDEENPIIKLRTWQPEKDPNFGIYGPEHFK